MVDGWQLEDFTPEPHDGVDGWELDDFTWDEKTGVGRFAYLRTLEDGTIEGRIIGRAQPYHPSHEGWRTGARA